tara:strand:+ start:174 stop:335 length:162 start_codon:yes stop_codon:yes gene_type:complete
LIESDEYLSTEDFENLESPYLIALMYPAKDELASKIYEIIKRSGSMFYVPWRH